jgi:hypothetical protein
MAIIFGPVIATMLGAIILSETKSVIRRHSDGESIIPEVTSLAFSVILGVALFTIFIGV